MTYLQVVVTNHGPGIYEAPLTIIDERPQGWKLLGGFPTPPWKCTDTDTGFKCDGEAGFAPGDSLELLLELKAPGPSSATLRQVENCARIEWPVTDRAEVSGDPNPNNDLACSVTSIIVPHEEEPPAVLRPDEPMQRDCPRGKHWDAIEGICVSTNRPEKAEPVTCPRGQHWDGRRCVCEEGMRWDRGSRRCVPREAKPEPRHCPPGMYRKGGRCVCMRGHHQAKGECIKCPRGHSWNRYERICVPPKGMPPKWQKGSQNKQQEWQRCPPGMHRRGGSGSCVCLPGHNKAGNQSVQRPDFGS